MAGARSLLQVLLLAALLCAGCAGGLAKPVTAPTAPGPPAECADVWAEPAAVSLVETLRAATVPGPPVWAGYGLEDGTYVLIAGESADGGTCLGAWRGGEALGYTVSAETPNVPTRLYGYLLPWEGNGGPFDPLVDAYRQPEEVAGRLGALGVERAVLLPVEVADFPIELSDLMKTQLAIHEAFHVEVEMPRWVGPGGDWPVWDLQPDRDGLPACYTRDEEVERAFAAERDALERLVSTLLDDEPATACAAGRELREQRAARYEMLSGTTVDDDAGRPGTCGAAEAVMELEEGTADFASWVQLYNRGQASREQLLQHYRVQQPDVYYLTGAMQAHALYLLDPDGWIARSREIAASETPEEGSLGALLERELAAACPAGG